MNNDELKSKKFRYLAIISMMILLATGSYAQNGLQNKGRKIFPSPNFDEAPKTLFATTNPDEQTIAGLASSSPALPLAEKGLEKLNENKISEAKEAFRNAIRLEPLNLSLWELYDESVVAEYNANKSDEIYKSAVSGEFSPNFTITRLDSYIELGTLYIVGTIKNISKRRKQKINLKARIFDENNREVRNEYGTLRNIYKSLYPNESSLFEIPIKNPPYKVKSYRVEVHSWED